LNSRKCLFWGLTLLPLIVFVINLSACSPAQLTNTQKIQETAEPSVSTTFPTGPVYTPTAAVFKPNGTLADLFQFTLDLINQDRQAKNLSGVILGTNAAAQKHAQDMFDNYYLSHWGTDGLKPYMRYTLAGGLNYEAENSAYSGAIQKLANPGSVYAQIDPKTEIKSLEFSMMNDDASSNWGHRDNILNKWHKKVNLGIAYDQYRLALVQEFEGDYLEWIQPPALAGNILSLAGKITTSGISLNSVNIFFDETAQPLTSEQLMNGPHSYGLGKGLNFLVSPPPPGMFYSKLDPNAIQASTWLADNTSGQFYIQADIARSLVTGSGFYTVVIIADINGQPQALCNYSIFVE
jgi:uncharacterized protein YkwD